MTATTHLGESQQPSVAVLDVLVPRLSHHSGLLGNLRAQAPTTAVPEFQEEELWLWATLNKQFGAARPESKLAILKRQKFTPAGREQRIRLALAALEAPQRTNLTLEQWKSVIEEVGNEDEE
jgi:hypothetical protein